MIKYYAFVQKNVYGTFRAELNIGSHLMNKFVMKYKNNILVNVFFTLSFLHNIRNFVKLNK